MTVIAYKEGRIAADSGCFDESGLLIGTCDKIWRHPKDKFFVAGAGHGAQIDAYIEWLNRKYDRNGDTRAHVGQAPDITDPTTDIVYFYPDGKIENVSHEGKDIHYAKEYAVGVNAAYTLGLMKGGMTPEEAVIEACSIGLPAAYPILVYEFGRPGYRKITLERVFTETIVANEQ